MTRNDEPDGADLGVLERSGAEVTLRFRRRLPHPPAKVWRALTEPEHLAAWFPTTVEGDLTPGATLRYNFREMNLPGFEGNVLACDPPRLLEFDWGDERLRFELTADGRAHGAQLLAPRSPSWAAQQETRRLAHVPRSARLRLGGRSRSMAAGRPLASGPRPVRSCARPGGRDHRAASRMGRHVRARKRRTAGVTADERQTQTQDRRAAVCGPPALCMCDCQAIRQMRPAAWPARPAPSPRAPPRHAWRHAAASARAAAGSRAGRR